MNKIKIKYIPIIDDIAYLLYKRAIKQHNKKLRKKIIGIDPSTKIGKFCVIDKNVKIYEGTYLGDYCHIFAGLKSEVVIGKYCAIGNNVKIKARTHDISKFTPDEKGPNLKKEASIYIGNHVWIGDNVFIREGITIEDHSIVAANSVVTKNIKYNEIWGGVPAKLIKSINSKPQPESIS